MQEELQNLLRCGYMRILQARYSLLRTNTSFILQPPTNSTASLGIKGEFEIRWPPFHSSILDKSSFPTRCKVTGGEYRVDDMFDGSKIQSNAIMPENESLANSIVDDDDNTLVVLAAKYDHNFEKNVPTR